MYVLRFAWIKDSPLCGGKGLVMDFNIDKFESACSFLLIIAIMLLIAVLIFFISGLRV